MFFFYKLILFYRVFTKLQVAFYHLKKFESVFEIWPVKVESHNRFPMGSENRNSEKRLFNLKSVFFFIFQIFRICFLHYKKKNYLGTNIS